MPTKYHFIDDNTSEAVPVSDSAFLIVIGYPRNPLAEHYLQGPRDPKKVKRDGYGFTKNASEAWPFKTLKAAKAKARILARHMNWSEHELMIEEHERPI